MIVSVEESINERNFPNDMNSQYFGYNIEQTMEKAASENITNPSISTGVFATIDPSTIDASQVSVPERRSTEKRASRKSNKDTLRRKDGVAPNSSEEVSGSCHAYMASSNIVSSKEVLKSHRVCIVTFVFVISIIFVSYYNFHVMNMIAVSCSQDIVTHLYQKNLQTSRVSISPMFIIMDMLYQEVRCLRMVRVKVDMEKQ